MIGGVVSDTKNKLQLFQLCFRKIKEKIYETDSVIETCNTETWNSAFANSVII